MGWVQRGSGGRYRGWGVLMGESEPWNDVPAPVEECTANLAAEREPHG